MKKKNKNINIAYCVSISPTKYVDLTSKSNCVKQINPVHIVALKSF